MSNIQVHYAEQRMENDKSTKIGIGIQFITDEKNQIPREELYRKTLEKLRKIVRDELNK